MINIIKNITNTILSNCWNFTITYSKKGDMIIYGGPDGIIRIYSSQTYELIGIKETNESIVDQIIID